MCADHRPRRCAVARPRQARGQALVEVLVAALVLVPLVLLLVWLGKVHAVRQATIAASRMLAFECAARPEACRDGDAHPELVDELRRRAFSRTDVQPLTQDRIADDAPAQERNPLWVDRANRPLIERFSDIGARIDHSGFDAGLSVASSQASGGAGQAVQLLSELAGPARFGLAIGEGLVAARVQAGVSASRTATDFSSQLDSIPLRVRATTAILTDAWNASGPYGGQPDSVEQRVAQGGGLPAAYEASIDARHLLTRGFIGLMGAIGLEPQADAFRYHEVDVDVVPADRLPEAAAPDAGGAEPPWVAP